MLYNHMFYFCKHTILVFYGLDFVLAEIKRNSGISCRKFGFSIALSVIDESEFAQYTEYNTLLNKIQEDRYLHFTGLDAANAPKYFLMDAVAKGADDSSPVQLNNGNPADNTVLSAQLRRAAAKVVINIEAGEKVEFMPYTVAEGSEGGLYYVRNLPYQTYLLAEAKDADDITAEVRNTSKSDSEYFTWSPETNNKNVSLTTYVYPHSWGNTSILEEETCVVMNLPLKYTDDQGNVHAYHNSWYKIPMTDDKKFERNNYYEVNIILNRPGAVAESTPVDMEGLYYAVDEWTPVTVNVGGEIRPDYLQLNTDHVDIYNKNSDDSSLRFASSTPIPADGITLLEAYYYNYLDSHNYQSTAFNVDYRTVLLQYFESPYNEIAEGFEEVFTDKMKFRLHRMKTGAHSDLQRTPKDLIDAAWKSADEYARKKYGDDYADIKGFSRYGAALDIYTVKK